MMYKKGQYFSFDAIVASVIFVLALVALLSYWHSVRSYLEHENSGISRETMRISNLLFVPSSPSGDCAKIERLGFANSWYDKRVNESILKCAEKMNGESLRANLSTYLNVSMVVHDINNNKDVYFIGTVPSSIPSAASEVSKMRRIATVQKGDGSTYLAAIDVYVYK